jgi:hypothetical protein
MDDASRHGRHGVAHRDSDRHRSLSPASAPSFFIAPPAAISRSPWINPLKKKALIARPRELIRVSPAMSARLAALSMLEVRLITTTGHSRQGARSEVHREVPTTYVRDVLPLDRLVAAAWQVLERFAGMATATMCPMTATSSSPSR